MNSNTDRLPGEEARPASFGRAAALLAGFAVAYYALAVFAKALPFQAGASPFIWPAEGLALGALLAVRRSLWVPFAGLAFLASLVVDLQARTSPEVAAATALVNALEPLIMAAVLARLAGGRVQIGTIAGLTGFLVNLVPLAAVMSLGDAGVNWWRLGAEFRPYWTATLSSSLGRYSADTIPTEVESPI